MIPVAIAGAVAINALANVSSTVRDDRFDLTMTTPKASYRVEEPIPLSATLTYLGPEENVELSSEYRDAVYFSLEQLDGPLDMDGGGSRLICYPTSLTKAEPDTIPFSKSGAFSSDTPGASFWASYFADPTLRLPAGSWRISAHFKAAVGSDCAHATNALDTAVSFVVAP